MGTMGDLHLWENLKVHICRTGGWKSKYCRVKSTAVVSVLYKTKPDAVFLPFAKEINAKSNIMNVMSKNSLL